MEEEMRYKEFEIPFSGLKQGKHQFDFQIGKAFFDSYQYDEFNQADIKVRAVLNKMSTMMELELRAQGTVNLACDLTSEPYDQPIESDLELVIKFGEAFNDEDDEILVLAEGSHQFNIAQYIYEMLVLAVPTKRLHPGIKDGTLNSEILQKLEELQPKEVKNEEDEIDPRWDALKSLLIDKKK